MISQAANRGEEPIPLAGHVLANPEQCEVSLRLACSVVSLTPVELFVQLILQKLLSGHSAVGLDC